MREREKKKRGREGEREGGREGGRGENGEEWSTSKQKFHVGHKLKEKSCLNCNSEHMF